MREILHIPSPSIPESVRQEIINRSKYGTSTEKIKVITYVQQQLKIRYLKQQKEIKRNWREPENFDIFY